MNHKEYPLTIENRWDILYSDYPEVYEEFARVPKEPEPMDVLRQHFPLAGKTVLDVGSGTGSSTFYLASYAREVIGVEPEAAMRQIAEENARQRGLTNLRFVEGTSQALPLDRHSVDMVTAITLASLYYEKDIAAFIQEAERVTRPGGVVCSLNTPSQWYGGELAPVITGKRREEIDDEVVRDIVFERFGYKIIDFFADQEYGSLERILRTYGFIFGSNAIAHLKQHKQTRIRWKLRIHYREVA